MNKLIVVMLALCNVFSLLAMEQQSLIPITQEESKRFAMHAQMAVKYSHKAVDEQRISSNNALHIITTTYPKYLEEAHNDLGEMIKNQDLASRLEGFKKFEEDETVKMAKGFLSADSNDVESKKILTDRRKLLAGLDLEKKQPTFSPAQPGEVQTDARINFMTRNKDYSLDDAAQKDYLAMLVFSLVLAQRIVIYEVK